MGSSEELNLPENLIQFLKAGKQFDFGEDESEAGQVKLHRLEDLQLATVLVDSEEAPFQKEDPNAGRDGAYEVPAVSLSAECDGFDPEFILLWLPEEGLFGSWDSDHYDLYVFPNATWNDIVANPIPYLDAQWDLNGQVGNTSNHFRNTRLRKTDSRLSTGEGRTRSSTIQLPPGSQCRSPCNLKSQATISTI